MRKREWKKAPSGKARGRPKKAPEELSAKYRLKLEGEERVKERGLAGMTKVQAQEAERKEIDKRIKAETKKENLSLGQGAAQETWRAAWDWGVQHDRPPGRRMHASLRAHCSHTRRACLQQGDGSR